MDENTLTFELGGQVDIKTLSDGFRAFHRLVDALTPKNPGIAWIVDDLQAGSATVTLRGESESASAVRDVVDRFHELGTALSDDEDLSIGFDADTRRAANSVMSLAASVEYARFATALDDIFIYGGNGRAPTSPSGIVSIGVITGTVQTVSCGMTQTLRCHWSRIWTSHLCFRRTEIAGAAQPHPHLAPGAG